MTKVGFQVQKRVVMAVTAVCIMISGCDDRFDSRGSSVSGEGKPVDVTLRIGLADEVDAYDLSAAPSTKANASGDNAAFGFNLQPSAQTRAEEVTSLKPDALYNLEIQQYDADGKHLAGSSTVEATTAIGAAISVSLNVKEHCQLVLVAWGAGNTKSRLGKVLLEDARKISVDVSVIKDLRPDTQTDMNKMPYVLHLKDVNVAPDGRIYSQDGEAIDVRLRLQRLAARLTFSWTYSVSNYLPQQILIHSIPFDYKVIASPNEKDKTYPSLLDQFTTIQVPTKRVASSGTYSCWIPANVRGSNPKATSQTYRIKSNAPIGSSYIRFIAVMDGKENEKKKLDYRIYIGGKETTDFNLYGNTDYSYRATFNHAELPTNDLRVTVIDPIPASENNSNFVPTANCFMVAPGGAFCFNPYKYYRLGSVTDNELLQKWCKDKKIRSVKVLWQTKENGDVGDPTLGAVSSDSDHTNIVDLKYGEDFSTARIYCRVAPNTTGGSGVIAAYDADEGQGNIIWSWHVWVTDYAPSATANETVLEPANKRVLQIKKDGTAYKPMMDRCLGAYDGYVAVPADVVDQSRANGFHYQRARKDPFPGSYPSEEVPNQYKYEINEGRPPKNCLNRYKPDGITWVIPSGMDMNSIQHAYQHPEFIGDPMPNTIGSSTRQEWSNAPDSDPDGRATWGSDKTIHDPCPAGWRVSTSDELQALINYNSLNWSSILANSKKDGGVLLQYDETANRTYVRFSGYPADSKTLNNVGYTAFWAVTATVAKASKVFIAGRSGGVVESGGGIKMAIKDNRDAQNIRCIQDR